MEKSSFFNAVNGDRVYDSKDFAEFFSNVLTSGIKPSPSSNLQVTGDDSYQINVEAGVAYINGYLYHNTTNKTFTIPPADGSLNRIDLVVVRLDLDERKITTELMTGEYSEHPVAKDITRNESIWELALAEIRVNASAPYITQANITDTRLDSSRCGIAHSLIEVDTETIFNNYQSWFEDRTGQFETDWNTWFESVKDQIKNDDHTRIDADIAKKANHTVVSSSGLEYKMGLTEDGAFRVYFIKEETGEEINVFTVDAGGFQFGQAIGATSPTGLPEFKLASNELQLLKPDGSGGNVLLQGDFGIGGTVKAITSLNQVLPTGFYKGVNMEGAPDSNHYNVLITQYSSTTTIQQIFRNSPTKYNECYIRHGDSSGWNPWKRMAFHGDFGIGGHSIEITGTNIDSLDTSGWYSGHSLEGGPPGVRAVAYVEHINYFQDGYALQKYFTATGATGNEEHWVRVKNGGDWRPWRKIELT